MERSAVTACLILISIGTKASALPSCYSKLNSKAQERYIEVSVLMHAEIAKTPHYADDVVATYLEKRLDGRVDRAFPKRRNASSIQIGNEKAIQIIDTFEKQLPKEVSQATLDVVGLKKFSMNTGLLDTYCIGSRPNISEPSPLLRLSHTTRPSHCYQLPAMAASLPSFQVSSHIGHFAVLGLLAAAILLWFFGKIN